jgi:hypothetical protein
MEFKSFNMNSVLFYSLNATMNILRLQIHINFFLFNKNQHVKFEVIPCISLAL